MHTAQLKTAKRKADEMARNSGKAIQVVAARSGYYVGEYPNANPDALAYVAKPATEGTK